MLAASPALRSGDVRGYIGKWKRAWKLYISAGHTWGLYNFSYIYTYIAVGLQKPCVSSLCVCVCAWSLPVHDLWSACGA